ncbi:EamA family transporter [Planococcus sp. ANT_H30]|uniref:DMT family transporter n=1 Tax=Planococcus sp. ANT_H30 TaxID=2597347 RepID=UPI0011EC1236|nr:EamA family transporter [Planococcus sp. ANT_H30]KAA0955156.1 EamA family transporter [Planococcus sp. ANT_H30]
MENKSAWLLIAIGASLWGVIGVFVTYLYEVGFTPLEVVAVRVLTASIFMVPYVLMKNRKLFKIKVKDSRYFIGTGIISIVLFNWCLFSSMKESSISAAFILLYTAPAFVTILSRIFFKEALTARKLTALLVTLIGCSLVIGIFSSSTTSISLYGLILGLGSGFFYALYSIFGKAALSKYDSLTVTVYTFLFATVAIVPFSGLGSKLSTLTDLKVLGLVIGLGFLSTMLPFIFYTKGLQYVESSRASIIATIEPVVASVVGFFIFNETLSTWQYVGMIMVISSVIIVQESKKQKANRSQQFDQAGA